MCPMFSERIKFIGWNKWFSYRYNIFWLLYINQIYKYGLESIIIIILSNLILMFIHNYKGDHFLGDAGSLMLSGFVAFLIIWLHNKNISHPSLKWQMQKQS